MPLSSTAIPTDSLPSAFHKELKNNYLKCHCHRRPYQRTNFRRHFTKSWKIITWNATIANVHTDGQRPSAFHRELKNNYLKCHYHRHPYRWIPGRQYVVSGSLLPTTSPTDCANSKERCIKCISDHVMLPTELPTDGEKYGG